MTATISKTKNYTDGQAVKPMLGMMFGCDPEIFVRDDKGRLVFPEFIPGTKDEPYKVDGGAIQLDGMAAEINIDPSESFVEFRDNIHKVTDAIEKMMPKGYTLSPEASVVFDEDVWGEAPDSAKELGCSPDFNAWTMTVNNPPDGEAIPRMRTAAGHIHIGWDNGVDVTDKNHINDACELVRQLDWYVGSYASRTDPDKRRSSLYGKAGCCRIKNYGVEYRVPSNFWLTSEDEMLMVWNRLQTAINNMQRGYLPDIESNPAYRGSKKYQFNDRLVKSINSGEMDKVLANHFSSPILFI